MKSRRLIAICGVRPHYVKWAGLNAILSAGGIEARFIDARQHYDHGLTDLMLDDLKLQADETIEHVSKDPHDRGGRIYSELCKLLARSEEDPPVVLVFGDVTTTAMGALAASRVGCRVIHVEAGVRSVPGPTGESIENRIRRVTAQLSSLNLCVSPHHLENLNREKAPGESLWVGDLGRNLLLSIVDDGDPGLRDQLLVHIHKAENMSPKRMAPILEALSDSALPMLFIVHPTVTPLLRRHPLRERANVTVTEPLSYTEMVRAIRSSRAILTDSGGVQREAYHLGRRCVVRRDTVGWTELFGVGGHVQVMSSASEIREAIGKVWDAPEWASDRQPQFHRSDGGSEAARAIAAMLWS